MDIKKQINQNIERIEQRNKTQTSKYRQSLLKQLNENINKKKQSVQDNQGLIDRYHGAKPRPLTQMQQAMQEAAQC